MKKFNRNFYWVIIPLILIALVLWWKLNISPARRQLPVKNQVFVIRKGESLSSVTQKLKEENLIRNQLAFKILVLVKGLSKKIKTGSFLLNPALDANQIVSVLVRGPQDLWLTFPEGWRKEEIALRLTANLNNFDTQGFLNLVKNLEGKLFPDTYLIPHDASPSAVVTMLTKNFEKKAKGLNLKPEDLVLASIVEREARNETDRPIVAGILIKRWQKNWPLQADATVQYAVADNKDWWPPLTKKDLKIGSTYNTYKYKGLPPAPICNPGLDSIKAVLNSQETPYWYYLSDKEGKIHYAQTIEEHNQNIAQYLK